jgi:hypothetical protein
MQARKPNRYLVLKEFFDSRGYSLNAYSISISMGIPLSLSYDLIAQLLLDGHLQLSFSCSAGGEHSRTADFYEISAAGIEFIENGYVRSQPSARFAFNFQYPFLKLLRKFMIWD